MIVITIGEMYFQCAKAIMRAGLWQGEAAQVPTAGQFIREVQADFDAEDYDQGYLERSKARMW